MTTKVKSAAAPPHARPPWIALPLADPTEAAVYDELMRRLAAWLHDHGMGETRLGEFVRGVLANPPANGRWPVESNESAKLTRYVLRGILANRGHAAAFDRVVERMEKE